MRELEATERQAVEAALDRFGPHLLEAWLRDAASELWITVQAPHTVFRVRRELAERLRPLADDDRPRWAGLPVGRIEGRRFTLSLEGAFELAARSKSATIVVGDKTAQLFLYGRDILGEGIDRFDHDLRPRDVAVVVSRRGEALGLAEVLVRLPARGRALRPVVDRGWYLREGH